MGRTSSQQEISCRRGSSLGFEPMADDAETGGLVSAHTAVHLCGTRRLLGAKALVPFAAAGGFCLTDSKRAKVHAERFAWRRSASRTFPWPSDVITAGDSCGKRIQKLFRSASRRGSHKSMTSNRLSARRGFEYRVRARAVVLSTPC